MTDLSKKHETIQGFVRLVEESVERGSYRVAGHWDADLAAIGLESVQHPGRLVYVSTHGCSEGYCYAELEFPPRPEPDGLPYSSGPSFEGISFEELIPVLRAHLCGQDRT